MTAALDLPGLARWMDGRGLSEGPITDVRPLSGGTQNVVLSFTRGGRRFVLRRPPEHRRKGSDETMRREARILAALAPSAVPHPRLIAACPHGGPLDAAFYLMEPVEGFNPVQSPPDAFRGDPEAQHATGMAMIDGLLALAAVDVDAIGLGDLGRREAWLERQVPRWVRRLGGYATVPGYTPPSEALTTRVADWLQGNQPDTCRIGIVHGDYHMANVMVNPGGLALAAIVDWELASIGDPLLDLGHLLATWPGRGGPGLFTGLPGQPTRDELVARYAHMSERDLGDLGWFRVLAGFRLGVILEGTYARSLAGKAPRQLGERFRTYASNLFNAAHDQCSHA